MAWLNEWYKRLTRKRYTKPFEYSQKARLSRAKLLKYLAIFAFVSVLGFFFLSTILFAWYAKDLPRPDKIVRKEGFATKIFDRNGELLYDVYADQRRIPVKLEDVPEYLRQATIAIEDKNFYKHEGFDPFGWARAIYNIVLRGRLQGGSTLTQQLVKNVLLSPERTIGRKVKEFVLAVQIEKKYSKDEILQMYLNEAPYGGTAWGVEAAAETYFGKKVSDLSLVESAILAGFPQKPSVYSPYSEDPKTYIQRTKDVLRRMREDDYISREEEIKAVKELEEIKFAPSGGKFKAPHFVMYVKKLLEDTYGEKVVEQGGLRVYTTLDLEIQEEVQKIVAEEIEKVAEPLHITNGAALVMDPATGEILAMVGSKDYFDIEIDGNVNVCTRLRQPGSAIKPVTYLTAFQKGHTPSTMIVDVRTRFLGGVGRPDYVPKNYDGKDHGPVQLRYALGSSLNVPSVKLLALVGIKPMLETAYKLGFSTLEPSDENLRRFGLSITLGGGEVKLTDMVTAYSSFANGGLKVEPVAILKVEDQNGKILEEKKPIKEKQIISQEEAYLISHILSDNNARLITFGVNSLLNIPDESVAVKTGTTDDMKDNWAVGWTPKFIVGVWVGNNDNSSMKSVASGISGASPIWRRATLLMLEKTPKSEFFMPSGIIKMKVDKISGYPEHDGFESREEIFIKGREPLGKDSIHRKLKLCPGQNKLATKTQIAKGEFEEKEFIVLKEDDPTGANLWQKGIDEWVAVQADSRYHPPTDYCEGAEKISVRFEKPQDHQRIDGEVEVEAKAVVEEGAELDRIELYVNGSKKTELKERPYKTNLVLSKGGYELRAKAIDNKGNSAEAIVRIGVKQEWDEVEATPTPSPSPTSSPTPSPSPSPTP